MFVSLALLLANCFVPYMDDSGSNDVYRLQNIDNVVQFNDSPSQIDSREDYYCNYDFNYVDDESLLTPQTYNLFSLSLSYTSNSDNKIFATFNRNSTELFNSWMYIEIYFESENDYTEQIEFRNLNKFTLYENRNDTSNCVIPVDAATGYIWDVHIHITFHFIDDYTFEILEGYIVNPNNSYGNGYNQGFTDGYDNGFSQGYVDGKTDGYVQGNVAGQETGYDRGYADGVAQVSGGYNFMNLFGAIADTPIMMLHGMFNFDIFGVNVLTLILSLLTSLMLLFVVKKIWK